MNFQEWLKTDDGTKCVNNQIIKDGMEAYLVNRMCHAFEAGFESGVKSGEHDKRLQKTLEWYESKLRECKSRNRKLVTELNQLRVI